jgi:hypothetical protein
MAEISLTAAFSSVPAPDQEAIKRLLTETVAQISQDDGSFSRAKLVFTESDERCGLTAELDGVKKEGVPLALDSTSSRTPSRARGRAPSSRRRCASTSGA